MTEARSPPSRGRIPSLRFRELAQPKRSEIPGNEPIAPRLDCAGIALRIMSFIEVQARLFPRIDAPATRATQANRQGLHGSGAHLCHGAALSRRDKRCAIFLDSQQVLWFVQVGQ